MEHRHSPKWLGSACSILVDAGDDGRRMVQYRSGSSRWDKCSEARNGNALVVNVQSDDSYG